jgi:hypothetical protein
MTPDLSTQVDSGATTYPMALDLASRLRWASTLPRVLCLQTSPPGWGGLWRCHMSHDSLRATCFKHKKSLADLSVQLATHVPNARAHIFNAPHIRVNMRLQDVQAGGVVNTYKACGQTFTVWLQYGYSMTTAL